jgi:hypothetical protein
MKLRWAALPKERVATPYMPVPITKAKWLGWRSLMPQAARFVNLARLLPASVVTGVIPGCGRARQWRDPGVAAALVSDLIDRQQ